MVYYVQTMEEEMNVIEAASKILESMRTKTEHSIKYSDEIGKETNKLLNELREERKRLKLFLTSH